MTQTPTALPDTATGATRRCGQRNRSRWAGCLGLLFVTAGFLSACGSSHAASAPTSSPSSLTTSKPGGATSTATSLTIVVRNFAFTPSSLTVSPGATVTVRNDDTATHTVTSTSGAFNTGDIAPGTSKTFVAPKTPGSYPYICEIHQFMHATLVVS